MTDVIGRDAAERSGSSFYAVCQPPGLDWHIPSHRVSPEQSPAMAAFVEHVDVVVTVHGFGRRGLFTSLLLGGQNRDPSEHCGTALRAAPPAYDIVTDLERIPRDLRGSPAANPVNLPRR